jgi:hypothetical protein
MLIVKIVSASRPRAREVRNIDAARQGGVGIHFCAEDSVARTNGVSSCVIVVEAGPPSLELCRWVRFQNGLGSLHVIGSSTADPVQELAIAIASSRPALVIECSHLDKGTVPLILELGRLPCYKALIGHRWLRRDPAALFLRIATGWSYCQVNSGEPEPLDTAKAAIDLQRQLPEFSIRDGEDSGLLWGDGRWFRIDAPAVQGPDGAATGDLFATAYTVARHFHRAAAREAVRYAERVVDEWNQGGDVPAYAC